MATCSTDETSGRAVVGGSTDLSAAPDWLCIPAPAVDAHKYDRGHTLVVSGARTSTGASRLAARAALRIGSGLVTVAAPSNALLVAAMSMTAIMLAKADNGSDLAELLRDERITACAIGMGLGLNAPDIARENVLAVLAARKPTVLDADALTVFATDPEPLFDAIASPVVLTPHAGEFARLFDDRDDRKESARSAAQRSGAVIVLKGARTEIVAPDGRHHTNDHATPYLATAGSGDVLAGMISGLMAQGVKAFDAARTAVWMHGDAGLRFGPGLIAEDLPEMLPVVLSNIARASHD